jgi:hypothetical protein
MPERLIIQAIARIARVSKATVSHHALKHNLSVDSVLSVRPTLHESLENPHTYFIGQGYSLFGKHRRSEYSFSSLSHFYLVSCYTTLKLWINWFMTYDS